MMSMKRKKQPTIHTHTHARIRTYRDAQCANKMQTQAAAKKPNKAQNRFDF